MTRDQQVLRQFHVKGIPATFATRRENAWKTTIAAQAPAPDHHWHASSIDLRFILPTLAPAGMPLDVDNLCEPVFSVLINQLGWFGKSRPRIRWWRAAKQTGTNPGCSVSIYTQLAAPQLSERPTWEGVYFGPLPSNARSPDVAQWATQIRQQSGANWTPRSCTLYLGFSHTAINLGDIATGPVKSFVDCLYPLLGGRAGAPADHHITCLTVEKGIKQLPHNSVTIKLWTHEKLAQAAQAQPATVTTLPTASSEDRAIVNQSSADKIANPCRPGTFKWIVCEAALKEKSVADVRTELDRKKKGAGRRLNEYISELRSENRLDIRNVN